MHLCSMMSEYFSIKNQSVQNIILVIIIKKSFTLNGADLVFLFRDCIYVCASFEAWKMYSSNMSSFVTHKPTILAYGINFRMKIIILVSINIKHFNTPLMNFIL